MSHYANYKIILLDGNILAFKLSVKTVTEELFDLVISHLGITEKEYFGLCYISDPGKYREWIAPDKRLVEQDIPKRDHDYLIHFAVKFYIDTVCCLHDPMAVEQFYLQARDSIFNDQLQCDSQLAFKLAALSLQVTGDFISEEAARRTLKKLNLIPLTILQGHLSLTVCDNEVLRHYRSLIGWSRGKAIINYLNKATELKGYGVHFYEVKDKNGVPWWIGMSPRGIAQYDHSDKFNPRALFKWNELDNVYFRDKKFSIEVNKGSKGMSGVEQKQCGSVLMHAWYSPNSKLIKSMWHMAVNQHKFYLEKRVATTNKIKSSGARSLNDIVAELSTSIISLDNVGLGPVPVISQKYQGFGPFDSRSEDSISLLDTHSLTSSQIETAQHDMLNALRAQRAMLMERSTEKELLLAKLQREEEDLLNGEMVRGDKEAGEVETDARLTMPTSYTIRPAVLDAPNQDEVTRLELEQEIQQKIIHAALRLAKEHGINKNVRKERRMAVQRAESKMQDIQQRLASARCFRSGEELPETQRQRATSSHSSYGHADLTNSVYQSHTGSLNNSYVNAMHKASTFRTSSSLPSNSVADSKTPDNSRPNTPLYNKHASEPNSPIQRISTEYRSISRSRSHTFNSMENKRHTPEPPNSRRTPEPPTSRRTPEPPTSRRTPEPQMPPTCNSRMSESSQGSLTSKHPGHNYDSNRSPMTPNMGPISQEEQHKMRYNNQVYDRSPYQKPYVDYPEYNHEYHLNALKANRQNAQSQSPLIRRHSANYSSGHRDKSGIQAARAAVYTSNVGRVNVVPQLYNRPFNSEDEATRFARDIIARTRLKDNAAATVSQSTLV